MNKQQTLRLGTRSTLLAIAQSRLVKHALEQVHPHLNIELIYTDTRGDRDQLTPLSEVRDPDFFSAELDETLIRGDVDFCVHSYKDLARSRPAEIITAAIPPREQPHDVILFRPDIIEHLSSADTLHIGTSSLRRQINIGDFLPTALPECGHATDVKFHALRGPVHERVQRLSRQSQEPLDGVVLALAGLTRLWSNPEGRNAIEAMLADTRWMVLPLSCCPPAHGQGALAIECRQNDPRTLRLLSALHDAETAALLDIETQILERYTADDTAGYGVVAVPHKQLGQVTFLRGRSSLTGTANIVRVSSATHEQSAPAGAAWDGTDWPAKARCERLPSSLPDDGALFVAHWRALEAGLSDNVRCWTSGVMSWRKLAAQNIWVEGCADNLGFDSVKELLANPVLRLPELHAWTAATHADAVTSWNDSGVGTVTATYRSIVDPPELENCGRQLADYRHFYWSSARQFEYLRPWLPTDAQHACGAGKTMRSLQAAGIENVQAFASREEWRQWLA